MLIVNRIHLGLIGCALMLACVARPAAAQSDADFQAARAAFDRGDRTGLDGLAPKLAAHVLQPYVAYWQLKLRLDFADDDEVKAFRPLATDAVVRPIAHRVAEGAGKARPVDDVRHRVSPRREDVELSCYGIRYRRQSEGEGALKAARSLWFTDKAAPDACEPLFAALIAQGLCRRGSAHALPDGRGGG
jgi:soluble lytic murein transglycosylase